MGVLGEEGSGLVGKHDQLGSSVIRCVTKLAITTGF